MVSVQTWLDQFSEAVHAGDVPRLADLFEPDGFWRDYLPFGWTLQTVEGRDAIAAFAAQYGQAAQCVAPSFEGHPQDHEGFFRFRTKDGSGRGYVRLNKGRCRTLFTMLENIHSERGAGDQEPFVLVVGGGQGGLALGAQLSDLGVPYLIIDAHPRVGDQWRSRYKSLVLHDPVWYDHMPFKPFPDSWPVFTPKDQMGDWLETYADELELNIQTGTRLTKASYDEAKGRWRVDLDCDGERQHAHAAHLVFALGLSGFPHMPKFFGQDIFVGPQMHSSAYTGGGGYGGKKVVIIGANNSAHDIATDLVGQGASPTLVQRSSTLVVNQADYCERILGPLYSAEAVAKGITTDKADILQASVPLRLLEKNHRVLWDGIRADRKEFYQKLTDAGFAIDFGEDGTGLGMKYRRTASGYYIDVGGSEMVMDGRIGVYSGHGVSHLSAQSVHLQDGQALDADAVIYATGYGDMTDWVAALIDDETAAKVGSCWGYGSGTSGDPGPWIGEQRNMWVETKQAGLWFSGGNLSQARFFSRLLALQLARRYLSRTDGIERSP